jgi:hypothetical protein
MEKKQRSLRQSHTFVVRIWWEAGLTRSDGRPLWRGQVHHAIDGYQQGFDSLETLLRFIQERTGCLEGGELPTQPKSKQELTEGKEFEEGSL